MNELKLITLVICIGNSDDKLTQKEWYAYTTNVQALMYSYAENVHFVGTSQSLSIYQNACFVCELEEHLVNTFIELLTNIKEKYKQESIVIIKNKTEFI